MKRILAHLIVLFFPLAGLVAETMAGPACLRVEKMIKEVTVHSYTIQFFSFNCEEGIEFFRDETIEQAKIIDSHGKIAADKIGGWRLGGDWHPPNTIRLVDTPTDFPFLVFHSSNYSPANISHSFILYSTTPSLKKYTVIDQPVNEWQVLNRKGSEDMVVGFYKNEKGDYLVDRITHNGKEAACSSCRRYDIEVLKITEEGPIVIDRHPYEFEKEQRRYRKLQLHNR